jgi:hypothetical protein
MATSVMEEHNVKPMSQGHAEAASPHASSVQ